jgi:hypothetical protein
MTTIDKLTQHFGIAPLQHPVEGINTLTVTADEAFNISAPLKPYWWAHGGCVTIITDGRAEEVAKALKVQTPDRHLQ